MAARGSFQEWLADFCKRWPAVANYLERNDYDALVDTWHQSTAAFDVATLRAVTSGIMAGDLEPVENTQLGQFGQEIRKRCLQLLDAERDRNRSDELLDRTRHDRQQYQPMIGGGLLWMTKVAKAARDLLEERGIATRRAGEYLVQGAAMRPDCDPYDAAIVLADDHTTTEGHEAEATLSRCGITWDEIAGRANGDYGNHDTGSTTTATASAVEDGKQDGNPQLHTGQ